MTHWLSKDIMALSSTKVNTSPSEWVMSWTGILVLDFHVPCPLFIQRHYWTLIENRWRGSFSSSFVWLTHSSLVLVLIDHLRRDEVISSCIFNTSLSTSPMTRLLTNTSSFLTSLWYTTSPRFRGKRSLSRLSSRNNSGPRSWSRFWLWFLWTSRTLSWSPFVSQFLLFWSVGFDKSYSCFSHSLEIICSPRILVWIVESKRILIDWRFIFFLFIVFW